MSFISQLTSTQVIVGKSSSSYQLDVTGSGNIDGSLNVVNVITANLLNLKNISGNALQFGSVPVGKRFFFFNNPLTQLVIPNTSVDVSFNLPINFTGQYSNILPIMINCSISFPNTITSLVYSLVGYASPYNYHTGGFFVQGICNNRSRYNVSPTLCCIVFY